MSSSVFRWYKVTSNVKNTPFSVPKVLSEPCTIYKRKVDSRIRGKGKVYVDPYRFISQKCSVMA